MFLLVGFLKTSGGLVRSFSSAGIIIITMAIHAHILPGVWTRCEGIPCVVLKATNISSLSFGCKCGQLAAARVCGRHQLKLRQRNHMSSKSFFCHLHLAHRRSDNSVKLHCGTAHFKSRPIYRILCLRVFVVLFIFYKGIQTWYVQTCHNHLVPNPTLHSLHLLTLSHLTRRHKAPTSLIASLIA
jgi:hypothetical protein